MDWFSYFTTEGLDFLTKLFVFAVGLGVLGVIILFIIDVSQTTDAVRRNYPVIGRFRHIFSRLGEFFRQYFFALDREEMPFNRAQREWVYKSSAGSDNASAFGSTHNLTDVGSPVFVNCPFPTLESDATATPSVVVGEYTPNPYEFSSIINISGMSYGALSQPAVRALSKGAGMAGCWLNTGEGGLAPQHLEGGADIVMQIGTAKYGVRTLDGRLDESKLREIGEIPQVRMFELKMSQGAKPGKGGILPAVKVTSEIAEIRGIPEYQDSISPNRHPEIDTVPEMLDVIGHMRSVSGKPVGFKTVVGAYGWLEEMCQEIHRRGTESAPDFITIDSGDGGTGAAPMALMDNVGLPIREALPLVADILNKFGLRERIKLFASGKLVTPAEVAWAYCAGADAVMSGRGFMFALGCIQAMKCNKNTCPTGVTTHNPRLQRGLDPADKAVRVMQYLEKMRKDVGIIAHSCGVPHPRAFKRFHCRIVQPNGRSIPLNELYPPVKPESARTAAE
jgi:glutamate synthase domain-containing protein 2